MRLGRRLPPRERIRPNLTWFLIGAVTAIILGWLVITVIGETVVSQERQIDRIRYEALESTFYATIEDADRDAGEELITLEIAKILSDRQVGAESDWANGFRAGWSDGWNDALDAMRAASIDAGATEDSLELQTLNAALERQAKP